MQKRLDIRTLDKLISRSLAAMNFSCWGLVMKYKIVSSETCKGLLLIIKN